MKLTIEQAVTYHRKLWNGIVKELETNGLGSYLASSLKAKLIKELFPEFEDRHFYEHCFLCQFVVEQDKHQNIRDCTKCPLVHGDTNGCLDYRYGEFHRACIDSNEEKALKLAKEIASLPVVNELYKESEIYENDR